VSTLLSYLEHLDYLHKQEVGLNIGKPPRVPCFLRNGRCPSENSSDEANVEEII